MTFSQTLSHIYGTGSEKINGTGSEKMLYAIENVVCYTYTHTHSHMHTNTYTHTHKPVLLRISGSGGYDCQFAMTRCKGTHGSHPWNVDLHEMVANR